MVELKTEQTSKMAVIRFNLVLMALLLASAAPCTAVAADPSPVGGWHDGPVFPFVPSLSDEFEGNLIDANKWQNTASWWSSVFLAENTQVLGGYAQLTTRVHPILGITRPILVSTRKVKYGYFEARIKTVDAPINSAFWLSNFGVQRNGDPWREIDTVEQFGSHSAWARRAANLNVHAVNEGVDSAQPSCWSAPDGYAYEGQSGDLPTSYHYYAVNWNTANITYYVDGVQRYQIRNTAWAVPMHIVLDSENKDFLGDPTSQLPATMSVDYVRVWSEIP